MKFFPTKLDGVFVIEPRVFEDVRGYFFESYKKEIFAAQGITEEFVQDNRSRSSKGTLRGLHFQREPMAQSKIVSVLAGSIFDVVVDMRPGSKTYGSWLGETLSAHDRRMIYVPEGMAHGFLALEEGTEIMYKVSRPYSPAHEGGIAWNDPKVSVSWPKLEVDYVISEKDQKYPPFGR